MSSAFAPDLLFQTMTDHGVDFIVIGGIARVFQGSSYPTLDCDVLVRAGEPNLANLAAALNELDAHLLAGRDVLSVTPDTDRLLRGLNFSWMTTAGQVDTFVDVEGGGRFEDLATGAELVATAAGVQVRVASLDQLIAMKRPLGRPKDVRDLEELHELRRLRDERDADS